MNELQVRRLINIACVIILIAVGLTLFNSLKNNDEKKTLLSEQIGSEVTKIQIDNSGETSFALEKRESLWMVDDLKADQDKVNSLIDLLKKSIILNVASTNSENYALFNVDDKSGVAAGFFKDNNKLITLVIGKATTVGNYVRIDGDANVYLVDQNISGEVAGNSNAFKDKTLSSGEIGNLNNIITNEFQINSTSDGFKLENNSTELDQSKTQSFVNNAINMKAFDVATEDESRVIEGKDSTLAFQVNFNDGTAYKFSIYKIDEDNYLAKREDGVVLKIYKSQFDNINSNIDTLKVS